MSLKGDKNKEFFSHAYILYLTNYENRKGKEKKTKENKTTISTTTDTYIRHIKQTLEISKRCRTYRISIRTVRDL